MKKRIKKWLLVFLGLEHTDSQLWELHARCRQAAELSESRIDSALNEMYSGHSRSRELEARVKTLEDKLSLIQEAAKPKEEKVIRHRRASEFKQAVERGLHQ